MRFPIVTLLVAVIAGRAFAHVSAALSASAAPPCAAPQPWSPTLIVPAYFYPSGTECGGSLSYFDCLAHTVRVSPALHRGGIVIANINSGPGSSYDPQYGLALRKLRDAESAVRADLGAIFSSVPGKVPVSGYNASGASGGGHSELAKIKLNIVGYVHTESGRRPMSTVLDEIARYRRWYDVDGFFIDETSSRPSRVGYYLKLAAAIRKNASSAFIVLNPGTMPETEEYMRAGDVIIYQEDVYAQRTRFAAAPWNYKYPKHCFATMYNSVPDASAMRRSTADAHAASEAGRCASASAPGLCLASHVFLTDALMPNPYNALASFWPSQVAALTSAPTYFPVARRIGVPSTLQRGMQAVAWLTSSNRTNKTNEYGYSGDFMRLAGPANSSARTQCASFTSLLFRDVFGYTAQTLDAWMQSTSPYAKDYYAKIVAERGWLRILDMRDVRPGDVVAMSYLDGATRNMGHVMQVMNVTARASPSSPLVDGTEQWEAWVMDSSESVHGPRDTRVGSGGRGIGAGVARLYSNVSGVADARRFGWLKSWTDLRPVFCEPLEGYTWSLATNSEYFNSSGSSRRRVVIGRPVYNYFFREEP